MERKGGCRGSDLWRRLTANGASERAVLEAIPAWDGTHDEFAGRRSQSEDGRWGWLAFVLQRQTGGRLQASVLGVGIARWPRSSCSRAGSARAPSVTSGRQARWRPITPSTRTSCALPDEQSRVRLQLTRQRPTARAQFRPHARRTNQAAQPKERGTPGANLEASWSGCGAAGWLESHSEERLSAQSRASD